ncbi:MAG: hypothetical protein COT88_00210 [Candidatus Colwellbacteria bacterium CG10_big_fil_rev_8_21_14_0_10_41_28]|uniref:Membrane-associated protein n=1 Tax=Candidatus Colwellbacteria bacterium CG10_big_fil_rev_8_21_14_0_10_41_28 TaxID=1974539 RepID=A0A2H0VHX2_9BACT|nr:MAG: hypothetical protein COT88_00210 [Candidatus Colwellbacteria bacterium CG10_big_fil_rev_8_21_14_0_10_41_28]
MKLDPKAFGLASGILWGAMMFVLTIMAHFWGYSSQLLQIMADIYPGYSLTLGGSIAGAIYGFIDGFIGAYLLAMLYNRFVK